MFDISTFEGEIAYKTTNYANGQGRGCWLNHYVNMHQSVWPLTFNRIQSS